MATVTTIELGSECNNRCVFCALRGNERPLADHEWVLERLGEGPEAVVFVGGEPLLNKALPAWIGLAAERGVARISVQTNGRLLVVRGVAEMLAEAGLTHIEVSLYGPQSDLHDYHTGVEQSFRQTARGLLALRAVPIQLGISTTVTRSNFRHLEVIAALAARVGARAWRLQPAVGQGAAATHADRVIPNLEMVSPWLRRALAQAGRSGLPVRVDGALHSIAEPLSPATENPADFPFADSWS